MLFSIADVRRRAKHLLPSIENYVFAKYLAASVPLNRKHEMKIPNKRESTAFPDHTTKPPIVCETRRLLLAVVETAKLVNAGYPYLDHNPTS